MKRFAVGFALLGIAFFATGATSVQAAGVDDVRAQLAQMVAQLESMLAQVRGMAAPQGAVLGVSAKTGYLTLEEFAGSPKVSCTLPALKPLARGNAISLLQLLLKQEGFYPEGFITGYYSKLTAAAVERFQVSRGFDKAGSVDAKTAAGLTELARKLYPTECGNAAFASIVGNSTTTTSTVIRITVTSPQAGETWRVREQRRIAWITNDPSMRALAGRVSITLNGPYPTCLDTVPACSVPIRSPYVIAKDAPDTGSYAWAIPQSLPEAYRGSAQVTVARVGTPAAMGRSDTFTIVATPTSTVGDVHAVTAPSDTESEAGILVAGREQVLSKIRFTATGEDMTVTKMRLLVNDRKNAGYRTGAAADEIPVVRLYDTNGTQVGSTAGYTVQASGDNAGVVVVENLGWNIPRDVSKTLVVKGVMNTIANGADSGARVYAHLMASNGPNGGFEAQGAAGLDHTIQAVSGYEKVVYKTKPTITVASAGATLGATLTPIIRFTIAADSAEQVSWKKVQLAVTMSGATMTAVTAAPGTSGNVTLKPVGSSNLNIQRAFSSWTAQGTGNVHITGGRTGYMTLILNTVEEVAAGSSKTYEVALTFQDIIPTPSSGGASASVRLYQAETSLVNAQPMAIIEGSIDGTPSFIWSDNSATGHSERTADWANSIYVKTLPSDPVLTHN
ncbi:MAG: peptidoglycan-binding protein [bacterium]|nr:peptidoglycan-binding protein [bacterium]